MNIRDAQKLSDSIVAIIKEEKESQTVSNYRLADMCNLSEAYLSYIFSYKRRPTLYTLIMITSALNIKLSEIIKKIEKHNF